MDLSHINKFRQCLVHYLLDLTIHLFIQIQNLQILTLDMDSQEFPAILDYGFLYFLFEM